MPRYHMTRRKGVVDTRVPLDVAVLLVSRPSWGRLNYFAVRPDDHPHQPLSEILIQIGYLSRLGRPDAPAVPALEAAHG